MKKFSKLPESARFAIEALFSDGPLTRVEVLASLDDKNARDYVASLEGDSLALFEVRGAIMHGEGFSYNDETLEQRLLDCYEDTFAVGLFASDSDALAAVEERQRADDRRAEDVLESVRGEEYALDGGPAYAARLCKYTADGLERVR